MTPNSYTKIPIKIFPMWHKSIVTHSHRRLGDTPEVGGKRRLTRLHLHTLAYQAIMVRKGSPWINSMAAATKAALTANRHVCGNSKVG